MDPKADELPAEGLSEDWTMFQNAFHLIQICGKFPATFVYVLLV